MPQTPTEKALLAIWAEIVTKENQDVHANFFALGGHSLQAARIIARMEQTFGITLPLATLFTHPTVAELAQILPIPVQPQLALPLLVSKPQPVLSYAQERLWFLARLVPDHAFYHVPMGLHLQGPLTIWQLRQTFADVIARHTSLRCCFPSNSGQPTLHVTTAKATPFQVLTAATEKEARALVRNQIQQPFDLAQGPLIRACLVVLGRSKHLLLLTLHHIIADGWSLGLLLREWVQRYHHQWVAPTTPIPHYTEYAHWQRQQWATPKAKEQLAKGCAHLRSAPPLHLPTDYPRPPQERFHGTLVLCKLPKSLSNHLKSFSQKNNITLFMVLLAAFYLLLRRFSGQNDMVIGTVTAHRDRPEWEELVSRFINTLPLRVQANHHTTFQALIKQIRDTCLQAFSRQALPFEQIVATLQPKRDPSRNALFQVLLILQNFPWPKRQTSTLRSTLLTPDWLDTGTAKFDLSLHVGEGPDGLQGYLEYNTDLFKATTIKSLLAQFQQLLQAIVANLDQSTKAFSLGFSLPAGPPITTQTAIKYPRDLCLHQLLTQQATITPHAVAVSDPEQSYCYQ